MVGSLAAAVAAVEAVAGKSSGGYLKNQPMVAARKYYSCFMTDLTGKIPVWFAGYCYYSKLL